MLTLFYFLPLLIADKLVLLDSGNLHVYLLSRKIADTVSSPTVALSELPYPSDLIEEHHSLFRMCYPDKKLIHKHHRMIRYPRLIRASGPLLRMMVMRFEAEHNFFKRLSSVMCHFKNIKFCFLIDVTASGCARSEMVIFHTIVSPKLSKIVQCFKLSFQWGCL